MSYPPRVLALAAAGVIITALCTWRSLNPRTTELNAEAPGERRPPPMIQLYDQESTLVKLEAFLHRHRIVVVFYDGQAGPESDENLVQLRQFYPALKNESIIVLGVSTALPQENRNNSGQPFPFPLLTDAVASSANSVHKAWDRFIEPPTLDKPAGTKPGVFLIDRSGLVSWEGDYPAPLASTESLISRLLAE